MEDQCSLIELLGQASGSEAGEIVRELWLPKTLSPSTSLTHFWIRRQPDALACLERLFLLGLTELRRLGEGEENDLLAGGGADVMVQAQDLDASDLLDHRFQDWPRRFDQVGPYFLEQVPPFLGWQRLDQVLFRGGQNALKADHEEITQQVGVNVLGPPTHVVLLKTTNSFTNSGFEFSQCSHFDFSPAAI